MNEFEEFTYNLLKRDKPRNAKIKNSWGSKYIYRSVPFGHILKKVDECTFLKIIRMTNDIFAEELAKGTSIELPYLGTLYVQIKSSYPNCKPLRLVDWQSTQKLWFEDKDAMDSKFLVKFPHTDYYKINWDRSVFNNRYFFQFKANRKLRIAVKDNVKNDCIFAYKY